MQRRLVRCRIGAALASAALAFAAFIGAYPGASTVAKAEPRDTALSLPAGIIDGGSDGTDGDAPATIAEAPGLESSANPPVGVLSETEPPSSPVTASISPDECRVALTAKGEAFQDAARVIFHVWQGDLGERSLIRHEAVRLEDGSWSATAFIASSDYVGESLPQNGEVADAVHRLYNPYSGQHLFTASAGEAEGLLKAGWHYEGVAWAHPEATPDPEPRAARQPVYRLYNPYSGDHFLTLDRAEYDALPGSGWRQEGVAFDSEAAPASDDATGTVFYGGYWFHSIEYYPGTFTVLDGTLGRPASHGCVRLAIENARWINQNIPTGTTVLTY